MLTPHPNRPDSSGEGLVLLIDDEAAVRRLGRHILTRLGYTVVEAEDGPEGVSLFRERRDEITLVLCDLGMPGMDGWETLDTLRGIDPQVRVIIASGFSEEEAGLDERSERPQVFMRKPYLRDQVTEAVRIALEQT